MPVHVLCPTPGVYGRQRVPARKPFVLLREADRWMRRLSEKHGLRFTVEITEATIARQIAKSETVLDLLAPASEAAARRLAAGAVVLCQCGHEAAHHVVGPLSPCRYGLGGFFGGCVCSRFRRRGYSLVQLRRADVVDGAIPHASEGARS